MALGYKRDNSAICDSNTLKFQEPMHKRKQKLSDALRLQQLFRDIEDEEDWIREKEPIAASTNRGRIKPVFSIENSRKRQVDLRRRGKIDLKCKEFKSYKAGDRLKLTVNSKVYMNGLIQQHVRIPPIFPVAKNWEDEKSTCRILISKCDIKYFLQSPHHKILN